MKFLFDFLPIILFFVSFSWAERHLDSAQAIADKYLSVFSAGQGIPESAVPITLATALAVVVSILQIVWLLVKRQKIEPTLWISVIVVVVFGGATIYFGSEEFIKWKPTVLYWLFSVILFGGRLLFRKNLIRTMMGSKIELPDPVWEKLNWAWALFFAFMGILNLYVAFWGGYETSTWVSFKLFGGLGLMVAFVIGQSIAISKYIKKQ